MRHRREKVQVLRLREAAEFLRVSERTLSRWVKARKIPCVRQGRMLLFPLPLLQKWLNEKAEASYGQRRQRSQRA